MKLEITCVCDGIRLPDLGLVLSKGDSVVVAEGLAVNSVDLARATVAGGVRTRIIKGPALVKDAHYRKDTSRMEKPRSKGRPKAPTSEEIFQQRLEALLGQQGRVFQDLLEGVQTDISENLRGAFSSSLQETLESYTISQEAKVAPKAELDMDMIGKVVAEAVKNAVPAGVQVSSSSSSSTPAPDDEPMFIPEGIVVDAAVADIGTSEGSSGFSVDEATEALRAMKKSKKT